jgi:hypothetical protein
MGEKPEQMLSRRQLRLERFRRLVFGRGRGADVRQADVEAAMLRGGDRPPADAPKPEPDDS